MQSSISVVERTASNNWCLFMNVSAVSVSGHDRFRAGLHTELLASEAASGPWSLSDEATSTLLLGSDDASLSESVCSLVTMKVFDASWPVADS